MLHAYLLPLFLVLWPWRLTHILPRPIEGYVRYYRIIYLCDALATPDWGVQNCGCKDETCNMGGGKVTLCLLKFLSRVFPCLTPGMLFAKSFAQESRGIVLRYMKTGGSMSRSRHRCVSSILILELSRSAFEDILYRSEEAKIVPRLCSRGIRWEMKLRSRYTRK